VAIAPLLCGYFKTFEVKIIILNRGLNYFCFRSVGKCQFLILSFLPNINSHLGVNTKAWSLKMDLWLFRCPVATNVASKGILLDTPGLNLSSLNIPT